MLEKHLQKGTQVSLKLKHLYVPTKLQVNLT